MIAAAVTVFLEAKDRPVVRHSTSLIYDVLCAEDVELWS